MVEKLEELQKTALKNNIPIIQKDGLKFIQNYIKENNVSRVLEIGSAIGYSAIAFALTNNDIKITTLERDKDRYNEALNNIKRFNLDNQITIYNIDAFDYEDSRKYDLIFIDAAKAQYIKFFEQYKQYLEKDGVIVSDNLNFHGYTHQKERIDSKNLRQLVQKLNKYITFLHENKEFHTEFYEVGDGIGISRRIS